tara:strand:+ start:2775 stop:3098 length:324 start_codon:yes stop_codon:yes gene_type:complete
MEWSFTFVTFDRNFVECGDNEQVIEADGKTIEEALSEAVRELPTTGVWDLYQAWVNVGQSGKFFNQEFTCCWTPTNDAPEFDEDEWEETDPHGVMRDLIRENYKQED